MEGIDQLKLELGQTLERQISLEKELSKVKFCIGVFQKELYLRSK